MALQYNKNFTRQGFTNEAPSGYAKGLESIGRSIGDALRERRARQEREQIREQEIARQDQMIARKEEQAKALIMQQQQEKQAKAMLEFQKYEDQRKDKMFNNIGTVIKGLESTQKSIYETYKDPLTGETNLPPEAKARADAITSQISQLNQQRGGMIGLQQPQPPQEVVTKDIKPPTPAESEEFDAMGAQESFEAASEELRKASEESEGLATPEVDVATAKALEAEGQYKKALDAGVKGLARDYEFLIPDIEHYRSQGTDDGDTYRIMKKYVERYKSMYPKEFDKMMEMFKNRNYSPENRKLVMKKFGENRKKKGGIWSSGIASKMADVMMKEEMSPGFAGGFAKELLDVAIKKQGSN